MAPEAADVEQLAALQMELTERLRRRSDNFEATEQLRVVNEMISADIVRAAAERARTGCQVVVSGASR